MAGKTYIGNSSGLAVELPSILIGDENDLSKDVQKIYVGDENNRSVKVWPSPLLPLAYQQVEYILNTNTTEYINTGVNPNSDTSFSVDFQIDYLDTSSYNSPLGHFPFGIYNIHISNSNATYVDGDSFGIRVFRGSGTYGSYYMYCYFGYNDYDYTFGSSTSPLYARHVVDFNKSSGFYIDDNLIGTTTNTFSAINKNVLLFGCAHNNGTSKITPTAHKLKLYHFKAWQGNTLIRDMYPCYLKSDTQTIGMYDLAGGRFYGNSGTGIFYKGPDVN